jgi:FlaA1/EpsC-like NDP-sugar epimerase
MYTEIVKIIEGGMIGDKEKVYNYAQVLAENMEKSGDDLLAKKIRSLLVNKKTRMASLDDFSTKPVDFESRMEMVDIFIPDKSFEIPILKHYVNDEIDEFIKSYWQRDEILRAGIEMVSSLLLYGPPGCGKTTVARFIAYKTGLPLVTVRLDGLVSSLLGSTAKNIRRIFDYASKRDCILFLDEADQIRLVKEVMGIIAVSDNNVSAPYIAYKIQAALTRALNNPDPFWDSKKYYNQEMLKLENEMIVAMPSVPGNVVREIMELAQKTPARIRILPGIYQSTNRSIFSHIRDIQMEDLLRREPVRTDLKEISEYISGHTVMVTGAGGSIGSELCRQILDLSPAKLVLVECCENNLFEIENELANRNRPIEIHPELIDVRHIAALEKVFLKHHPQVVFHAAAYKHVPMMERHPEEAFYNNVLGTRNMAVLSDRYGVETFIFISTDKAVNPTSVMGASKRLAEMIIRDVNHHSKTNFAAVRFGNVLGSRGSVIPTFIKQIEQGGPVTVTHPEMKRYFMTIPEAVQLVIQAGAMAKGGEIFVLDMGKPVKIVDLAKDLIRLAGYEPGVDIEIKYTGIRPGEKLYEELFTNKEQMVSTKHERIFISNDELEEKYNNIEKTILTFAQVGRTNNKDVVEMIKKLVPEYRGTAGEQERDEMVVG